MKTFAAELACFVRRRAAQNLRLLLLYCTFLWEPRAGEALQPGIPVTGRGTR